jgi:hypothetical protein
MNKEKLIKFYVRYKGFLDRFSFIVYPFLIIIAFTLVLPTLQRLQVGWIWAFVLLILILDIVFTQLEHTFKKETDIANLLQTNKKQIEDLERDIKHLERLNIRKNELKLDNPKKKISLIERILIWIVIIILSSIIVYFEIRGGLK